MLCDTTFKVSKIKLIFMTTFHYHFVSGVEQIYIYFYKFIYI